MSKAVTWGAAGAVIGGLLGAYRTGGLMGRAPDKARFQREVIADALLGSVIGFVAGSAAVATAPKILPTMPATPAVPGTATGPTQSAPLYVTIALDASPTGAPVTIMQGGTLVFQAPAGGIIDTISKQSINAASYSGAAQNIGSLTTPVTWHDASGTYTTTIPITIVAAGV